LENLEVIQIPHKPDKFKHLTQSLRRLGRLILPDLAYTHLWNLTHRVWTVVRPTSHVHLQRYPSLLLKSNRQQITVISANLWHDWPFKRNIIDRLESFAQLVESNNADIILLQEVSRSAELNVDEWLANRLGMAYLYSRANGSSEIGFEEGLAIFSRYPIQQPVMKSLGKYPSTFVRRIALGAHINTPVGGMLAMSVHLGLLKSRNTSQHADLRQWVDSMPVDFPVLVGGDFNAHETSPQISQVKTTWLDTFRHMHPAGDATTHELHTPWGSSFHRRRLDYIFLRHGKPDWRVLETKHLATDKKPHSDHRIVLTRLALSPTS